MNGSVFEPFSAQRDEEAGLARVSAELIALERQPLPPPRHRRIIQAEEVPRERQSVNAKSPDRRSELAPGRQDGYDLTDWLDEQRHLRRHTLQWMLCRPVAHKRRPDRRRRRPAPPESPSLALKQLEPIPVRQQLADIRANELRLRVDRLPICVTNHVGPAPPAPAAPGAADGIGARFSCTCTACANVTPTSFSMSFITAVSERVCIQRW